MLQSMESQRVGQDRVTELNFVLLGGAMLSKSLIQFSVDGQGSVPSLLFDLGPNYGGDNEDNGNLLQKVSCVYCYTQCSQLCSRPPPAATHYRTTPPLEIPGHSWACLGQFLVASLLLSPGS